MKSFKDMIEEIVKSHKDRMPFYAHNGRMTIIADMKAELELMKSTWEMLYPNDKVDHVSFEQVLKQIQ